MVIHMIKIVDTRKAAACKCEICDKVKRYKDLVEYATVDGTMMVCKNCYNQLTEIHSNNVNVNHKSNRRKKE